LPKLLTLLALIAVPLLCPGQVSPRPQIQRSNPPETTRDPSLEKAIQLELGQDSFSYSWNRVHLSNGSGVEALVHLGGDFCGSGGCTSLVFAKRPSAKPADAWSLISRITLTRTPIVVSAHRTNGWHDLILFVAGGGIQTGYYSVLAFNGKTYPENPTVKPATPLRGTVRGVAWLAGADNPKSAIVVSPR
jgi:hypothetical protein